MSVQYLVVGGGLVALVLGALPRARARRLPRPPAVTGLLPVAVAASAVAAALHASAVPERLVSSPVLGAFFVVVGLSQLLWVVLVLSGERCGQRRLLEVAVLGNLVVLGVWAGTRLWSLPGGLLVRPEPIGAWDLACVCSELLVVACCTARLVAPRLTALARA